MSYNTPFNYYNRNSTSGHFIPNGYNESTSEPVIVIERHYVPTSVYNQNYLPGNNMMQNRPGVLYDRYGNSYYDTSGYAPAPTAAASASASTRIPTRTATTMPSSASNWHTNTVPTSFSSPETFNRIFDVIFPPRTSRTARSNLRRNRTPAANSATTTATDMETDTNTNTNANTGDNNDTDMSDQSASTTTTRTTTFPNGFVYTNIRNPSTTGSTTGNSEPFGDLSRFMETIMNGISNGTVTSGGYSVTFGQSGMNDLEDVPIGLTPQQINEYTELVNYTGEEEITCSVCQNNIEEGAHCRKVNGCNHHFHHNCLDTWLTNHSTCPNCRADLRDNDSSTTETENNTDTEDNDRGDNDQNTNNPAPLQQTN